MNESLERLVLKLFDAKVVMFGSFEFKHHELRPDLPRAPMKLNLRGPDHPTEPGNLTPELVGLIAREFHSLIQKNDLEYDRLSGIPRAGEPFSEKLSQITGKPLIKMLKEENGGKRKIAGLIGEDFSVGEQVLLADDVLTLGDSKREALQVLENAGLGVAALIVLVDRQEGGQEILGSLGYRVLPVLTVTEMLSVALENNRISFYHYETCTDYLVQVRTILGLNKDL